MLSVGSDAPNFSLEGDDSQVHSLKNFRGKNVVIFFYPKDLTPGCTQEACDFSENLSAFTERSTTIVGISKDSLASHASFKSKHSLNILLLTDPDLAVHKQYDAYGAKTMYGKTSMGVIRTTILVDAKGKIAKIWSKVRVKNHVQAVLDTVSRIS